MNAVRKKKIGVLGFFLLVLSLVAALVLYALRQNISLFYTPTQVVSGVAPQKHLIRVGGMVEKGSIVHAQKGLDVQFKITDFKNNVIVLFTGILPDLFREGQGIVVSGELYDNKSIHANQVLAKHDANYMPPEVKAALGNRVKK